MKNIETVERPIVEIIIAEHEVYKTNKIDKYSKYLNRPPLELLDDTDFIIPLSNSDILDEENS